MSGRMLYSQRKAMAAMGAPRRVLHRVLWRLYWPFSRFATFRRLWGLYRQTWTTMTDLAATRQRLRELAEATSEQVHPVSWPYWITQVLMAGPARDFIEAASPQTVLALLADTPSVEPAGRHEPGDNHDYRIECTVCGERGVIRLSVDPGRFGGREALDAGTHEPAVDDFGNQYLAAIPTQASDSPDDTEGAG